MVNNFLLKEFGDRIRQLRVERKYSQEKLSFLTGFHRTYIGMIERGERNISLTHLAVFAKVFEMPIGQLLDLQAVNPLHSFADYQIKFEK